jgi:hypothetical protein
MSGTPLPREPGQWRPVLTGPAPLCACGCGTVLKARGRKWPKVVVGHANRLRMAPEDRNPKVLKRNAFYRHAHVLPPAAVEQRLAAQGGTCAICATSSPGLARRGGERWCVDLASDGALRGVLCRACRAGVRNMREDATLLAAAAKYLKEMP